MVHLGDITKMSGYTIQPVDVITFGSPCQDLSIAGKRAGMAGERSGLFSEAVRIIREMRYATFGAYPKYAVWENVPGAFSSNKGEDFHAVLQSLCRVIDPDATIPRPTDARGGIKWPRAGAILADHYSLAWRTMDAQHWGVPQRRLRISLVLDLTGGRAGEILFEPESLRGHFAPGITPGQAAPVVVGGCTEDANRAFTLKIRSGCEGGGKGALVQTEKSATLSTLQDQTLFVAEPSKAYSFDSLASNSMKSSNPHSGCREVEIAKTLDTSPPDPAKNQGGIAIVEPTFCIQGNTIDRADTAGANSAGVKEDVCYTLNTIDRPAVAFALDCRNMTANEELSATLQAKGNGGQSLNYINPVAEPLIYDARGNGDGITSPTMTGDHNSRVTDYTAITLQGDTVAGALLARDYKGPGRADSLGRVIAQPVGADLYNGTLTGDKAVTLTTATGQGGANTGPSVIEKIIRWIVRRLTPTECERLQGYPDGWTDLGEWIDSKGKTHKDADTPRYKALGNSIALPQWYYVLGGIADRLPDNATLGSLFDGIGGFPYVWAQLHAGRKELCVWASEIEEFPIAVTKKWFPEVEDGKLF
ncbi:DNA cytosine methyltransferase [Gemmiger formicilis]|jgi:DNA (cytosine-5)-methyltransferase 1|uniref:DNA cytosine methyltransferase n=1 Tax=Gemmiger formicilis TaxID=745368 RepID=UPI0035208201